MKNHYMLLITFTIVAVKWCTANIFVSINEHGSEKRNSEREHLRRKKSNYEPESADVIMSQRSCKDNARFRFMVDRNGKRRRRNCSYLSTPKRSVVQKRKELCHGKVARKCKWSCGACSNSAKDDSSFSFQLKWSGKVVRCKWITDTQKKKRKDRQAKYCSNPVIRNACKLSCGYFTLPTYSPTSVPTLSSAPSNSPSLSSYPSNNQSHSPSELPSMKPSFSPTSIPSSNPTTTPSNLPSTVPSMIPSSTPTSSSIPSFIPTSSSNPSSNPSVSTRPSSLPSISMQPTICENDSNYSFLIDTEGTIVSCDWLSSSPILSAHRRRQYCNLEVTSACKWSCGSCESSLFDDESFLFVDDNNIKRSCDWLTIGSDVDVTINRQEQYCEKVMNTTIVEEKCKLSCAKYNGVKRGLITNDQTNSMARNHFLHSVSWTYNFDIFLKEEEGASWFDLHGIEYVPMIAKPWILNETGANGRKPKCVFRKGIYPKDDVDYPLCTTEQVIDDVARSKTERKNGAPVRFLIGFNELYKEPFELQGWETAYFWSVYVQPAAVANNLTLVSPTLNANRATVEWFATFLKQCYKRRNDEKYPCDVNLIKKLNIHQYDCKESLWNSWYNGYDSSLLISSLLEHMEGYQDRADWLDYFMNRRKLWITETSCMWDIMNTKDRTRKFRLPYASSKEQCEQITGKKPDMYGRGSLAAMESLDSIERYAWWTLWNPKLLKPHYLTTKNGALTPVGRGFLNPGDKNVDCDFNGDIITADTAILHGQAELFFCKGTGTQMIRNIGRNSTVEFKVSIETDGNHAINVSYMSAQKRQLSVQVNNNYESIQRFEMLETGKWCHEEGISTVLTLELDNFTKGENTITFGVNSTTDEAFIEWISIED